jgi:quinolinate synthase
LSHNGDEETPVPTSTVYSELKAKLSKVVPDFELRHKAELAEQILQLKAERNAVILGHNYMEPALFHSVPDFTGDSLFLCRKAAETDKERIVFCGVRFMAETAKIINPGKTVLLPAEEAGCSLAASLTGEDVRQLKQEYPGIPVVVYINTYADVKAEADYCCTSGNAAEVVRSIGSDTVIFLPDEYLARNVAHETGMRIIVPGADDNDAVLGPEGGMVGWPGRCEVHEKFTVDDVTNARKQFPGVLVLAHPECSPAVVEAADFAGSTAAMIREVKTSEAPHYLLLTECSMGDNIVAENPEKEMVRFCSIRCPHMNQITLEDTLKALEQDRYVIDVPEPTRTRAARSIERMLAIG